MLYSIRMRSAEGGAHETGGRHISGAERLVKGETLQQMAAGMIERALSHSRGTADYIRITIEQVQEETLLKTPCLPIYSLETENAAVGREQAKAVLVAAGVSLQAVQKGMEQLLTLPCSLRGAMLLDAESGERLDECEARGIRVSRMDIEDEASYRLWLKEKDYENIHIREAVVLASKVVAGPGVVAELCWSDDPEYTAGYVATPQAYTRFTHLKPLGSEIGGRIFFVEKDADIVQLTHFLERQPVCITLPDSKEN